jgi:hypothetical protein
MRLLILALLALSGCALFMGHVVPARMVDASETTGKVWICVPDNDERNPGGVMCGEMGTVMRVREPSGPPAQL